MLKQGGSPSKAKRVEIENVHSGRGSTLMEPRNGENKGTSLQLRKRGSLSTGV